MTKCYTKKNLAHILEDKTGPSRTKYRLVLDPKSSLRIKLLEVYITNSHKIS